MINKVKTYFDNEVKAVARFFTLHANDRGMAAKNAVINNAIAHCFGVTMFVQELGIPYDEVAPLYEEHKAKLEKLYN